MSKIKLTTYWSCVVSILLITSCAKDQKIDLHTDPNMVTVLVSGITNPEVNSQISARAAVASPELANHQNVPFHSNIENAKMSMELECLDRSQDFHDSELVNTTTYSRSATSPMQQGVKFWIALYNTTTKRYEHSVQGTSGTPLSLAIVRDQEYEWWAYSYNSTESIPEVNPENPIIETTTDKPLLYAKGKINFSNSGDNRLAILFINQLKQIRIDVDTRGLFGDMETANVSFLDDYIKTAEFNLYDGQLSADLHTQKIDQVVWKDNPETGREKYTTYYTSDFSQDSYSIIMRDLIVKVSNQNSVNLTNDLPNGGQATFSFQTNGQGVLHQAKLRLRKIFPIQKILHVEDDGLGWAWGYTGYNPATACGGFLRSTSNFSETSPYLRVKGFDHERILPSANNLANRLANPDNYPDMIIMAVFGTVNDNDYNALYSYLQNGGAVLLMLENVNGAITRNFFRKVFNSNNVNTSEHDGWEWGGAVYKIADVDKDVLSWPFADVRNQYWGQDGGQALAIDNIPEAELNNIFAYTRRSANKAENHNSVTMFRHKKLNLFYVGDTGFTANNMRTGQTAGRTSVPYATDNNYFPALKAYGAASGSQAQEPNRPTGSWNIYNAAIFGNVFSYFVAQSYYGKLK
ncbi:hypothetical protein M8998_00165 [Sphingobacterium sp. lm-10]|uniref:hypothetical protein n=1 Tax=Sphingobacterium sp. lm-10 TaxID=2944904 RepID=UPI002020C4FE|nr:hypothetical protein [Sphingobacterium sp. lm-10]MCL7986346.1 hypothetical protein [Sphingobacterium sp. lm-10]